MEDVRRGWIRIAFLFDQARWLVLEGKQTYRVPKVAEVSVNQVFISNESIDLGQPIGFIDGKYKLLLFFVLLTLWASAVVIIQCIQYIIAQGILMKLQGFYQLSNVLHVLRLEAFWLKDLIYIP